MADRRGTRRVQRMGRPEHRPSARRSTAGQRLLSKAKRRDRRRRPPSDASKPTAASCSLSRRRGPREVMRDLPVRALALTRAASETETPPSGVPREASLLGHLSTLRWDGTPNDRRGWSVWTLEGAPCGHCFCASSRSGSVDLTISMVWCLGSHGINSRLSYCRL
ncbi:hypothetical protein SEVIR_4G232701v4 [Setaria viridis]